MQSKMGSEMGGPKHVKNNCIMYYPAWSYLSIIMKTKIRYKVVLFVVGGNLGFLNF